MAWDLSSVDKHHHLKDVPSDGTGCVHVRCGSLLWLDLTNGCEEDHPHVQSLDEPDAGVAEDTNSESMSCVVVTTTMLSPHFLCGADCSGPKMIKKCA